MADELSPSLPNHDLAFIGRAADYLEHPGFLMRTANLLGKPVEALGRALPAKVQGIAASAVDGALRKALKAALLTLPAARDVDLLENKPADEHVQGRLRHSLAVGVTGAVAGLVGASALAIELPITTVIMLRDIAGVAQSLGEDLSDPEVRLQCVGVFNLAGAAAANGRDDKLTAMDSSYYASRLALSGLTREAARYAATVTVEQLASDIAAGSSPVLVRFVSTVASRFGIIVNQKLVAQAVPAIGAVGGALVNAAFNDHFDRVARYHFGLRQLERRHGREAVQAAYQTALRKAGEATTDAHQDA